MLFDMKKKKNKHVTLRELKACFDTKKKIIPPVVIEQSLHIISAGSMKHRDVDRSAAATKANITRKLLKSL